VTLVVDVEPVVDGVALQVGNEPCNVDDCHDLTLPFCCDHSDVAEPQLER
jgi:hypothetical protein